MTHTRAAFAVALRERGLLDPNRRLVAAWPARVRRIVTTPTGDELCDLSPAVLGASAQTGYLLTARGVLPFPLADLHDLHSRELHHLGFTVTRESSRTVVELQLDMPLAVAGQLAQLRRAPASTTAGAAPPAKRRTAA